MVAIDLAVSDLSSEDGALEWLLESSDLSERQKDRVRGIARDNLEGAIKLFYSMDGNDGVGSVFTFDARRFGHKVSERGRVLDELVADDGGFDYECDVEEVDEELKKDFLDYFNFITKNNRKLQRLVERLFLGNLSENISKLFFEEVNQDVILNRLEMVANSLEKSNGIVVPSNIVGVSFKNDILIVNEGRRNFNKNPIDYYNKNYAGVRVKDLKKFDQGLYDSLVRYRQIHLIRSIRGRDLSDPMATLKSQYGDVFENRLELYERDNRLHRELFKLNLLEDFFPINLRNSLKNKIYLTLSYYAFNGDIKKILSENNDFVKRTIQYYWKRAGFVSRSKNGFKSYKKNFQEPRKLSDIYDVAKKFGFDMYQFKKMISEMGLREKFGFKNGCGFGNHVRSLILGAANRYSSALEASREIGVSQSTILRHWRENRLNEHTRRRNLFDPLGVYEDNYGDLDLSRTQLSNLDMSLFRALRRECLLDEAIPIDDSSVRLRQRAKESYFKYRGDVFEACREESINYNTLRNIWKNFGFSSKDLIGKKVAFKRGFYFYLAKEYSSAAAASMETGVSQRTILRHWREEGLHEETKKNDYEGNPLLHFQEKYKGKRVTRGQLKKENSNLSRALVRYGQMNLAIPEFRGYVGSDKDWIVAFYEHFKGNAVACSKAIGKPRRTISKWWKEIDLPNSREYKKLEKNGKLDQIIQKIQIYFKS
jgi:hypothetical protein